MFFGAKQFQGDSIGEWNTSQVTTLRATFRDTFAFNGDISTWNVGKVTNLRAAFRNARAYAPESLNAWDVSQVRDMGFTFTSAPGRA